MDDDKFGVCGLIWISSMLLFASAFRERGFPIWLTVILSLAVSLVISTVIYIKWAKQERLLVIKVGVFWVSVLINIDIIYDIEEYPDDYQFQDALLTYSKQHKDVWEGSRKNNSGANTVFINLIHYRVEEYGMIQKKKPIKQFFIVEVKLLLI